MSLRRFTLVALLSLSLVIFVLWAWREYRVAENHIAVRDACESILPGSNLDDAISRFKPFGKNSVDIEGALAVIRVAGPASCKCKIAAEKGKVERTYAWCIH